MNLEMKTSVTLNPGCKNHKDLSKHTRTLCKSIKEKKVDK